MDNAKTAWTKKLLTFLLELSVYYLVELFLVEFFLGIPNTLYKRLKFAIANS